MKTRHTWILCVALVGCEYEHSNFFDPAYEEEVEILAPDVIRVGHEVVFELGFPGDQGTEPRFLWTSDSPEHLRFRPPCLRNASGTILNDPCGEARAVAVRAGMVRVTARYFGPRAEDFDRSYSRSIEIKAGF